MAAMTSADVIGALLAAYICPCGQNCASHWTRSMVLDKRMRILELRFSKPQFHQFLITLMGNFYDEDTGSFQFRIGVRVCSLMLNNF